MGQRIDQFCESLRLKLTNVDSNMHALKAKIDGKAQGAEQDVQNHLNAVKARIEQQRAKVAAAQVDMKNWAEERKPPPRKRSPNGRRSWKKLSCRAEPTGPKAYAAAAIDVAMAAVDEAEQASLEAWLARRDADFA